MRQATPQVDRSGDKPRRRFARWFSVGALALASCLFLTSLAEGDRIVLQDGTTIEGTVEKVSGSYVMITSSDGKKSMMAADKIASVDGEPYGNAGSAASGGNSGGGTSASRGSGDDYNEILDRCDRIKQPVQAVDMWDRYLARKDISPANRKAAEEQRDVWQTRYDGNGEKIRGAWVLDPQLKELKDQASELVDEARELEERNTTSAMRKYQEALALYPNSFRAHYRLGFIKFHQGYGEVGGNPKLKEALRHSRSALELQPDLPAVLSSMGAVLFALKKYEEGIEFMYKATQKAETPLIVGNLLTAMNAIPPQWLRANKNLRQINIDIEPLRQKYGAPGLYWVEDYTHGVENIDPDNDIDNGPPGLRGKGSGFFITESGFLLTNRHVAETDDGYYYRVRLADKDDEGRNIEYPARFIASDDEHDVALLKVELPEGETVPFLRLSPDDEPPLASQVMVLGYPTTGGFDLVNQIMQVATGTVKSINPNTEHEVWFDLSTTSGNSGGPIVDKHGNVIALLTAGLNVQNVWYVLGVGMRQVREFMADATSELSLDDLEPGTDDATSFDSEKLAADARQATLLVLIFVGDAEAIDGASDDGDDEDEGDAEDDGGRPGIGADSFE